VIEVVETWLNDSIYQKEIELENYSCIRIDRKNIDKTKGGGILVYIRDNLIYNDLTDRYCPNIDYAWVKISENNGRNITVGIFIDLRIAQRNIYSFCWNIWLNISRKIL